MSIFGSRRSRSPQYLSAVGISYGSGSEEAPLVSVKGEGLDADALVRVARRFGIAVVEDNELAETLGKIEIDAQIPPSLYEAVAIILAHLIAGPGQRFPCRTR